MFRSAETNNVQCMTKLIGTFIPIRINHPKLGGVKGW